MATKEIKVYTPANSATCGNVVVYASGQTVAVGTTEDYTLTGASEYQLLQLNNTAFIVYHELTNDRHGGSFLASTGRKTEDGQLSTDPSITERYIIGDSVSTLQLSYSGGYRILTASKPSNQYVEISSVKKEPTNATWSIDPTHLYAVFNTSQYMKGYIKNNELVLLTSGDTSWTDWSWSYDPNTHIYTSNYTGRDSVYAYCVDIGEV